MQQQNEGSLLDLVDFLCGTANADSPLQLNFSESRCIIQESDEKVERLTQYVKQTCTFDMVLPAFHFSGSKRR